MKSADFLVIGGGIAGVSAAARLAPHGRTILLEAESALGYHSSGRSATFYHFGIGNSVVRGLTAFSRDELEGETDLGVHLSRATPALFIAREEMLDALHSLEGEMRRFTDGIEAVGEREIQALAPAIRCGADAVVAGLVDHGARRLDADALQQNYLQGMRKHGGESITDARVTAIQRNGGAWLVTTGSGERYAAPVLVNAAGAWADAVARLANVRPLGLRPLRRTIIVVDAPPGTDVSAWPFTKTAVDNFYMLPEAGALLASPVDEVPSEPTDARPEEYDVALAAAKVEEYTSIAVRRIRHSWAGLRTFASDRVPVAGFAPDADSFFWLAGQGGYGLQTAPAMSRIAESLIVGGEWPRDLEQLGIGADAVAPERLLA